MDQYRPETFKGAKSLAARPLSNAGQVEHLFEPRKRGYPTTIWLSVVPIPRQPRPKHPLHSNSLLWGAPSFIKASAQTVRTEGVVIPSYRQTRRDVERELRARNSDPGHRLRERRAREVAAREAATVQQLALERMPRSRIAEITRRRAEIAPVGAKATGLFAAFDAAVAGDKREQNSLENILKAKMQEFGRQVRTPYLLTHVDFEERELAPKRPPREDYKDFSADLPVRWINGLPVPQKPIPPKATGIKSSEGLAGPYRLPAEKRTENDRAVRTDEAVRERIKEIVAFDDIFDRERKGLLEHNDNATSRIAAITKANCDRDAQAWWVGYLPDRGLSGEALNNHLKAAFSADYNAFLNFRRTELISCERRVGRLSPSQPAVWSQPPRTVASPMKMATTFLDWREAQGQPVVSAQALVGEYLVWRERYLFWRGRPTRSVLIVCPSST